MAGIAQSVELPPVNAAAMTNVAEDTVSLSHGPAKRGWFQTLVTFVWDHDYYDKSAAERRLVFKLDCFMLTALTIGWWLKNIDQSNLNNAYVSGMKEDLHITGNQYTYMGTIYNAVMAITTIPSNMILLKVRPSYYLACAEIGWGVFTFAQAGAKTYQAMYGFRFGVAFFESAFYPAAFYILGSWYNRAELAKRIALWFLAGPAGNAFSGYLQAAIYSTMDGKAGLAGWRWLYVICGLMTVPCGFLLFFLLPDYPETTRCWYITEEEKLLAKRRCARNGVESSNGKVRWSVILKSFKNWRFWVITPAYCIYGLGVQNGTQFAIYLKANGYSVTRRNVMSSGMYLCEIPTLLTYSYIADRIKYRWIVCISVLVWALIPTGILAFWAKSHTARVFAFMVNQTCYMTPVFYAWVSEVCAASSEERSFIIATTSTMFFVFNAFLPTIIFRQTDGPRFKRGFPSTFSFIIASLLLMILMAFLHVRQQRQEQAAREQEQREVEAVRLEGIGEEDKVPL